MTKHRVVLVPGFLGFQRLWVMPYFAAVEALLAEAFTREGLDVTVEAIRTLPTASLGQRAARLAEVVAKSVQPGDVVHIVGHSTGGLDARLFASPGACLPTDVALDDIAGRVRSIVSVATPHRGTPLAAYMTGVHGHRALRLLSMIATQLLRGSRTSARRIGLSKVILLIDALAGLDDDKWRTLAPKLQSLQPADSDSIDALLHDMGRDTTLLEQLTPPSLELFNNTTRNRPGIRYGCVVARAPRPDLKRRLSVGFDPIGQVSFALYGVLHRLTAQLSARRVADVDRAVLAEVQSRLGKRLDPIDSDGLVPTLSQVWGDVVHTCDCDHLDLMGYYGDDTIDLLQCGAPFDRERFERVWLEVGRFCATSPLEG